VADHEPSRDGDERYAHFDSVFDLICPDFLVLGTDGLFKSMSVGWVLCKAFLGQNTVVVLFRHSTVPRPLHMSSSSSTALTSKDPQG
jgi:hypothetical protein